jgi:hypothetical protein
MSDSISLRSGALPLFAKSSLSAALSSVDFASSFFNLRFPLRAAAAASLRIQGPNEDPALPLKSGEEALDEPASDVAA